MLAALEAFESLLVVFEGEDLIDNRVDRSGLHRAQDIVEVAPAADGDSTQVHAAVHDPQRIDQAAEPCHEPDQSETAARPGRSDGALEGAAAADLHDAVDASAPRNLQDRFVP